ncbi:MAG: 4Fe-4S dicluster domain-containing protein [Planctomycetota bacterium]
MKAEGRISERKGAVVPAVLADLCTGCDACVLACAHAREGLADPARSRITISRRAERAAFLPRLCLQCVSPPCLPACPSGARHRKAGAVTVEASLCIGCRACVSACPAGAVRMDPEGGVSMSCDTCAGEPACVPACTPGALRFLKPPVAARRHMRHAALLRARR